MFLIFFMRTREKEAEVVTEQYVKCLGCFEVFKCIRTNYTNSPLEKEL